MSNQQRTVVYNVKVNTSDAKKGSRDMKITMQGMRGDVQKTTAQMERLGKTIGEQYNAEVKVAVNETATARAEMRRSANEVRKAERNYQTLSREFKTLTAGLGRTAEEQEQLNALHRLGAGATLTQRKETLRLVKAFQEQRNAAVKTQGSMRGLRGQMQNIGFQAQDIAVQMQMGTNAFTIFSQQGSQLAAGFGPTGALVGAGIAFAGMLGAVLAPTLFDTTDKVKELREELEELAKTTALTEQQAAILASAREDEIKASAKRIRDLRKENKEFEKQPKTYREYVDSIAKTTAGISALTGTQTAARQSEKSWLEDRRKAQSSYDQRVASIQKEEEAIKKSQKEIKLFNSTVGREGTETLEKWKDENDKLVESLAKQAESIIYSKSELLKKQKAEELALLTTQDATEAQIEAVTAAYDVIIADAQRTESAANLAEQLKEQAKAERERNQAAREAAKELTEIKRREALLASLDIGDTSQLDRRYREELKLIEDNEEAKAALLKRYARDYTKIAGTEWEKYLANVEEQLETTDEIMIESLDRFSAGFGSAFSDAVFESESLGDALSNLFVDVGKNMVAFFAEWAAQELILWGVRKALGTQTGAGEAIAETGKAQAGVLQAGIAAFTGAAATPIIGPAIAPGAMAAAMAITAPMAASIAGLSSTYLAGFYDQGGVIPQNAIGIVAEYGNEIADGVMIKGAQGGTRVTGREETAKLLNGGGSGGANYFNINGAVDPESVARAIVRRLKKGDKSLDTAIFESSNRGRKNRGKRFA